MYVLLGATAAVASERRNQDDKRKGGVPTYVTSYMIGFQGYSSI